MNEKKRKRLVYTLFIVAVLWGLYNEPWKRPKRSIPSPRTVDTAAQMGASQENGVATSPTGQGALSPLPAATAGWTVDPFRPSAPIPRRTERTATVDTAPTPTLQGTMTVKDSPTCVLDGRVYRTGDHIGEWRIVEIAQDRVVLQGLNKQRLTLRSGRVDAQRGGNPR